MINLPSAGCLSFPVLRTTRKVPEAFRSGAEALEETYGTRVMTIVNGEDIIRAIEKGIV